jgi:hypothetical protein
MAAWSKRTRDARLDQLAARAAAATMSAQHTPSERAAD